MKKTYSVASKLCAMLTAAGVIGLGCTAAQDSDRGGDDPGSRAVTMEVWTNLPDDSGVRTLTRMGTNTATLDDMLSRERSFVIDGGESSDLARVRSGAEIVVPLNTGETATLVRKGDRLELASFTGDDDGAGDLPRGAVQAVRLLDDGIEVFLSGSDGTDPDTIVHMSGIEDLDAERAALVTSLALDTILVSLEDSEQIAPAVAIAIIAAIVGSTWLFICGGLAWHCADQCQNANGFETQCAGLTVTVDPPGAQIGGGYSCRCL
ncbi:MAG TPA: hypothetical protein VKB80_33530 [Kofleriaceae bacterium]|nr:hypothetical protein [Kofleriaceae bacterium]